MIFTVRSHRLILKCIRKLNEDGIPSDLVTVVDALNSTGDLDRVGGIAYISNLTDAVPSSSAATYYAKIVAEGSFSFINQCRSKYIPRGL